MLQHVGASPSGPKQVEKGKFVTDTSQNRTIRAEDAQRYDPRKSLVFLIFSINVPYIDIVVFQFTQAFKIFFQIATVTYYCIPMFERICILRMH